MAKLREPEYTLEEVKELIREFHKDFCVGTGTESLMEEWIEENIDYYYNKSKE